MGEETLKTEKEIERKHLRFYTSRKIIFLQIFKGRQHFILQDSANEARILHK